MEKRKRILAEQKKRAEKRKKQKQMTMMTGGLDDANAKPRQSAKKKSTSKLAALPISGVNKRGTKSRLNPSVDYDAKQKEKDKKKVDRRTGGPGKQKAKGMGKSPGALGGKSPEKKVAPKKSTEKFSSFGAAFKAARAKGLGTKFTFKGERFTAIRDSDIPASIKGTKAERLKKFLNMKKTKKKKVSAGT